MEITEKRTDTTVNVKTICEALNFLNDEMPGFSAVIFDDVVVYTDTPHDYMPWGNDRFDRMVPDIFETIYFA